MDAVLQPSLILDLQVTPISMVCHFVISNACLFFLFFVSIGIPIPRRSYISLFCGEFKITINFDTEIVYFTLPRLYFYCAGHDFVFIVQIIIFLMF